MLKLKRFSKGKWFDVPGFKGVKVRVRPISQSDIAKIIDAYKKKVKVGDDIVDDYEDGALSLELFKFILEDFEGIETDEHLTKEEMKEVIFDYDVLRDFISETAEKLRIEAQKELDEDLKNLRNSQGG